ncbi:Mini-ribonuclease 3 [Peptostreptococcus russellii]|uniref:Mini-ribonuclease 3 n=1 Tax=Peptostreptococcus russellii TaxID=215200 RepID=A0A2P7PZD5_9FIRM|nr:ribonuclease III domain-containing protein [Peptostreptococcus russellii]PSJ31097.1 Mini-ribonuclease 3 [Peptostreptococcus russellii]
MEENIIKYKEISKEELARISPLTLAYLGDTVYESYIREYLIRKNIFLKINDLHKLAIKYVNASAQSKAIKGIEGILTQEEENVFKRGRNHKKNTSAKNASVVDYRHSTGFEAVIGYLYLDGDDERLEYIIEESIDVIENI